MMMSTLTFLTDPTRHLALQYLVLAFSQLRIREEALQCLDDLLAYLAAEPAAPMPDGCTRGQLALAYLHDLKELGICRECDFRWLREDAQFQHTLERYRLLLEAGASQAA